MMRTLGRRVVTGVVGVLLLAAATGCDSAGRRRVDAAPAPSRPSTASVPVATAPTVRFVSTTSPVAPNGRVTVRADGGSLAAVSATAGGAAVAGRVAPDGRSWTSSGYLPVNARVRVRATVRGATGSLSTREHVYRTVPARDTEKVAITPQDGSTVGVAMPIVADFDNPVSDRAAVERRLVVDAVPATEGSWHWMSDRQVIYRPASYWTPGTRVTVTGDLRGVELSKGVWGAVRKPVTFRVGADNEDTVDLTGHKLTVATDGVAVRTIPVTTGKPDTATRQGIKVIMSQEQSTRMNAATTGVARDSPDYYDLQVHWAQRLTYSGEYLHAAPWSTWAQGRRNVSHGCTGMSDADAQWLMTHSQVGDPVRFVNGTRPLESGNGWTMWNMSYAQWQNGSAL